MRLWPSLTTLTLPTAHRVTPSMVVSQVGHKLKSLRVFLVTLGSQMDCSCQFSASLTSPFLSLSLRVKRSLILRNVPPLDFHTLPDLKVKISGFYLCQRWGILPNSTDWRVILVGVRAAFIISILISSSFTFQVFLSVLVRVHAEARFCLYAASCDKVRRMSYYSLLHLITTQCVPTCDAHTGMIQLSPHSKIPHHMFIFFCHKLRFAFIVKCLRHVLYVVRTSTINSQ